jgi:thiamine biosynthesis lipoprotein
VTAPPAAPFRRVRIEEVMGTIVGVDVRDVGAEMGDVEQARDRFFDALRDVDRRFSPWQADSEISRIADGRLGEADASPDVRRVLAICDHLQATTTGAFDARRHRPDGRLDPSGFVKGWAVEEAAWHLVDAGLRDWSVNAGGDILTRGTPQPPAGTERPWRVGIRHPDRADRLAAVLEIRDLAVATSGLYERGVHIHDRRPGLPETPRSLRSLTVVGPSLAWADAYATAGFVMGLDGLAWVARQPGYGALAITPEDRLVWTAPIAPLLVRSGPATARGDASAILTNFSAREPLMAL